MDGHVATRDVTLNDVEQRGHWGGRLEATFTFNVPNARLSLADDSVQYRVIRDDFFYHDLQFKPEVRSALASIGAYTHADLRHAALQRLSKNSLNDLLDIPSQVADPAIINMLYTDIDATAYPGFKAVLYKDFAAKEDNTYILAFAGTDDTAGEMLHKQGFDWAENLWQGLGWDTFQYQYAMQAATAIQVAMESLVEQGASFTTTGHSLGGGLASAASVVTGAPGITFNAAGLHTNTLRQFIGDPIALETALQRYNQANGLITAFHVDFDFLTTLQVFGSLAGLPTALGTPVALDGPYDLQAGAAFVIAISVPGILGAVPLAGTEVQAHLMPAVLWGLLVDEGIFSPSRDTLGYDWTRFYLG
jgi:hypothetical protein